jgi:alpha-L-rhamnosidase
MKRLLLSFILLHCILQIIIAQAADQTILHQSWKANWITVPGESSDGYGVYLFRKSFSLHNKPDSFFIQVSADNRYKLYVNEHQVSLGPARGDLEHWNYEILDIAPFLHTGLNTLAAEVWNEGAWRAEGQISLRTGFILQSSEEKGEMINSGKDWKCLRDPAFQPLPFKINTYYVAGPGELVNLNDQIIGWTKPDFDDNSWKNAETIMQGMPENMEGGYGTVPGWLLKPSSIPAMELKNQRFAKIVRSEGSSLSDSFPYFKSSITIPAHNITTIILDQGFLTNAYPELVFSGGRGGSISLSYAEALFTKYPSKGNRNETDGKIFIGRKDSLMSNGKVFHNLEFSNLPISSDICTYTR